MPARLVLLVFALACARCAAPPRAGAPEPRPAPPPQPPADVAVHLDEAIYRFDAAGRRTLEARVRYQILSEAGLARWSTVTAAWAPWYQARPELTARVIDAGGRAVELDPATIEDAPARDGAHDVDQRVLRAPLPALAVGAIVEHHTVTRDEEPFFGAGTVEQFYFGAGVTVERARLVIETPLELPLHWSARGLELEPELEEEGDTRRAIFERGPFPPVAPAEALVPPELPAWPHVAFSTGPSWNAVASRYAELVDRQIEGAEIAPILARARGASDRAVVLRSLVRAVHDRVRYTEVELGDGPITPRRPEETLARGHGDGKDLAALLVAALRARGIEAHVALLRAGTGEDVPAELPGLDGFNHAIVFVPGEDLWIDATAPTAPIGYVPLSARGRLVLVAHKETTALVQIPAGTSADSGYNELREVHLAHSGAASVRERSSGTGSIEQRLRTEFARVSEKDLRTSLESYVKSAYSAEGLGEIGRVAADDVDSPFQLELNIRRSRRGYTDDREAAMGLALAVLFTWLPPELRDPGAPARLRALELAEPYHAELVYRIHPPRGFTARALPADVRQPMGRATLERRYRAEPDGSVIASFRFDTGERRWSAAEVMAFRGAFARLEEEPLIMVRFDHAGAAALAAGRVKDALGVYRSVVAEEPALALHHTRLASALLQAGFGDAARAEARRAVELDPASIDAQFTLGFVLEHDLFGRDLGRGYDRAGSIAAYERAKQIDPRNVNVRRNLAIVREHDAAGIRYAPGAELDAAVAEYRAVRDEVGEKSLDLNLMFLLLEQGRFREALELARVSPPSPTRSGVLLAAAALVDGPGASIRELDALALEPAARQQALDNTWTLLARLRRYPEAAAAVALAAERAADRDRYRSVTALLSRVKRREEIIAAAKGPAGAVLRALAAMILEDRGPGLGLERRRLAAAVEKQGMTIGFAIDLAFSTAELDVDGHDDEGHRVVLRLQLGAGHSSTWYVVREKGDFRVRAAAGELAALGAEALSLLGRGRTAGARRWLAWGREEHVALRGEGVALAPMVVLVDGGDLRATAASLMVASLEHAAQAVAILEKTRGRLTGGPRVAADHALAVGYRTLARYDAMVPLARALADADPESPVKFALLQDALRSGRIDEAVQRCEARLARVARDAAALHALAALRVARGDFARAIEALEQAVAAGSATARTYHELAWSSLFLPGPGDRGLEWALRAAQMTGFTGRAEMSTLAATYAELGKTADAVQALRALRELGGEPDGRDWYVIGRIAEQYALDDVARAAYEKVPRPAREVANDVRILAERRLAAMGPREDTR